MRAGPRNTHDCAKILALLSLALVWLADAAFFNPYTFDQRIEVLEPKELEGLVFQSAFAQFAAMPGLGHGLEAYVTIADPIYACEPITSPDVRDTILLVDRGHCEFYTKAMHGRDAKASAVLISNVADRELPVPTWGLDHNEGLIPIPTAIIMGSDGITLKKLLKKGVPVKLRLSGVYIETRSIF